VKPPATEASGRRELSDDELARVAAYIARCHLEITRGQRSPASLAGTATHPVVAALATAPRQPDPARVTATDIGHLTLSRPRPGRAWAATVTARPHGSWQGLCIGLVRTAAGRWQVDELTDLTQLQPHPSVLGPPRTAVTGDQPPAYRKAS
jgi:hypothetical protein